MAKEETVRSDTVKQNVSFFRDEIQSTALDRSQALAPNHHLTPTPRIFKQVIFRELKSPHITKLHPDARVLLSGIPGSRNDLKADLREIDEAGVDFILCLAREGELGDYGRIMGSLPYDTLRWYHCPTPPSCGAEAEGALKQAIDEVIHMLLEGRTVLIHCQAGQIRTGCAAASLLVLLGSSREEASIAVEDAGSFPFNDGPLPLLDVVVSSIRSR